MLFRGNCSYLTTVRNVARQEDKIEIASGYCPAFFRVGKHWLKIVQYVSITTINPLTFYNIVSNYITYVIKAFLIKFDSNMRVYFFRINIGSLQYFLQLRQTYFFFR